MGDSTDTQAVRAMFGEKTADCVWTDPPYGVEYTGKTADALTIENDGAAGLPDLINGFTETIISVSRPGAPVYIAHPAGALAAVFHEHLPKAGLIVRQNLVWVKNTFALGRSDYHYRHEPIIYGFTPGGEGRLGRGGNNWYGDNSQDSVFEVDKPARNADHPTMKPPSLILEMLRNSLPKRGIVFDCFGGSGSTMVAAHMHGSAAYLVELDPRYADVICRRYQELTGELPTLNGQQVDFIADFHKENE
ncbi:DNA-methyltransferase [Corynebacterium diphtheriae]